jgi:hypothetical protein
MTTIEAINNFIKKAVNGLFINLFRTACQAVVAVCCVV